jgi:hypothetical protein
MQQYTRTFGIEVFMCKGEGFKINGHRIYAINKSSVIILGRKSKVEELKKVG